MIVSAGVEEFKASKRTVLDDAEAGLDHAVGVALADYGALRWYEPILDAAVRLFAATYDSEQGAAPHKRSRAALRRSLSKMLAKTKEPGRNTARTIRNAVASYAVNFAFQSAAEDDPETLELEWVTMHDKAVRATHQDADGQVRALGSPFHVGHSEMAHPGDTSAPIDEWAGCRCLVRPVKARVGALVAAGDNQSMSVIVALPAADDPVHNLGPEQSHCTLIFLGLADEVADPETILAEMRSVAAAHQPDSVDVTSRGELGDDKAQVLNLNPKSGEGNLASVHSSLLDHPAIAAQHAAVKQYPQWTPHLTLGYPNDGPISDQNPASIRFDRLALWHGDAQTEHPLGGTDMTAPAVEQPPVDAPPVDEPAPDQATPDEFATDPIPWHGTIVVEGGYSGDGRQFAKGSLRNRDLPLPLTWQKFADEGHKGSVVVGKILGLSRIPGATEADPNLINAYGTFLANPEADEAIGLAAEFGRWGVSIDADDATMEVVQASEAPVDGQMSAPKTNFTDARVCSASLVAIPAFAEATITLGSAPDGFMGETPDATADPNAPLPEDAMVAAGDVVEAGRGPGWVTDPVATRRIHAYWTSPSQPGFAKIGWGGGGDFNRCRAQVGKYLAGADARFINATCAQWHFDALGYWPSTHAKMLGGAHGLNADYPGSIALVASGGSGKWTPKAEWFSPLQLERLTRTTYVEHPEGTEVFGHIAEWGTCHTGFAGVCVTPPPNNSGYALFHRTGGGTMTDQGLIDTGVLTVGGGHASVKLGIRAALAHYDSTSTAIVDCRVGDDVFGIWFHGWVRPSASDEQRHAFRAAKLSGDWRMWQGEQELMLACAVNLAGFPSVHVSNGRQDALVAAGVLPDALPDEGPVDLAAAIAAGIRQYKDQEAAEVVAASVRERHQARVFEAAGVMAAQLRARHEGRNH